MFVSAQSLKGAEAVGGWGVSTDPSAHTPNQVKTVPRLGQNFAQHRNGHLGLGRGQRVGVGILVPEDQGPSKPIRAQGAQVWIYVWAAAAAPGSKGSPANS